MFLNKFPGHLKVNEELKQTMLLTSWLRDMTMSSHAEESKSRSLIPAHFRSLTLKQEILLLLCHRFPLG